MEITLIQHQRLVIILKNKKQFQYLQKIQMFKSFPKVRRIFDSYFLSKANKKFMGITPNLDMQTTKATSTFEKLTSVLQALYLRLRWHN